MHLYSNHTLLISNLRKGKQSNQNSKHLIGFLKTDGQPLVLMIYFKIEHTS